MKRFLLLPLLASFANVAATEPASGQTHRQQDIAADDVRELIKPVQTHPSGSHLSTTLTTAIAEPSVDSTRFQLVVELTDGSLIKGQARDAKIDLKTPYAALVLPFSSLSEARVDAETKALTLTMLNDDVLSGTTQASHLTLRTLFGKVSIDMDDITQFNVVPSAQSGKLLLHYSFDKDDASTVSDDSGNRHMGTAHKLSYVDTPFGKGIRTSSRDTYVSCDSLSLNGARQLTVSTWIKLNRFSTYSRILNRGGKNESGGGGFGMTLGGDYGSKPITAMFGVSLKGGKSVYVKCPKFAKLGEWTHLVGTYNGREVAYYANGVLLGKEPVPRELRNLPIQEGEQVDLFAGKCSTRRTWYDTHLDGVMDEVRIESRAWSATEVSSYYLTHKPNL